MHVRKVMLASSALLCVAVAMIFALVGTALANLPDHRVFEQVSPVEKGGEVFQQVNQEGFVLTDASGEHAIVDGGVHNSVLSSDVSWMYETRTPTGWKGVQIGPSPPPGTNYQDERETQIVATNENLSRTAFQTMLGLDPRDVGTTNDIYVHDGTTEPFTWASGPPSPDQKLTGALEANYNNGICAVAIYCYNNNAQLAGTSADLSDVVWSQRAALLTPPASLPGSPPDTHASGYEVYESVNGTGQLVGVVPSAGSLECGSSGGGCVVPRCGAAMGNVTYESNYQDAGGSEGFAPTQGAVSGDGSQVVFTSPDPNTEVLAGCPPAEIYVRDEGAGSTVEVSGSQKTGGDPVGAKPKIYAGSAEEGGQVTAVFFTSREELTNDANTGSDDQGEDLYSYSLATGRITDLTPDENSQDEDGADVMGFIGASSDGSLVYFTASGVLAAGASAGQPNLYLRDVVTGKTTFVASGSGVHGPQIGEFNYRPEISSEVTPDGQNLVFRSSENLTSYNQDGYAEIYLYSAPTNRLSCISCNPSGAAPVASALMPRLPGGGFEDRPPGTLPAPRMVSDDGTRVFFSSGDQLTPEAPTPKENEYYGEFEPNLYEYGNGHLYLIAPEATLLRATPSGNDVFFQTRAQLVPQDGDGTLDVYDARVDGGFPALASPACSGTSCQGVPAAPPIFATPPSVTFAGVGNFPPPSAAPAVKPGKAKKKAKAKKKKTKKRKRAKKSRKGSDKGGK
jgi:hypothetical protein